MADILGAALTLVALAGVDPMTHGELRHTLEVSGAGFWLLATLMNAHGGYVAMLRAMLWHAAAADPTRPHAHPKRHHKHH